MAKGAEADRRRQEWWADLVMAGGGKSGVRASLLGGGETFGEKPGTRLCEFPRLACSRPWAILGPCGLGRIDEMFRCYSVFGSLRVLRARNQIRTQ